MDNKSIHRNLLEILKTIDEICKKENFVYMINQGTLLGAVREKGFIEWDIEDADIMMHRKDFNAFEKYCKESSDGFGLFISYSNEFVPRVAFKERPGTFVEIVLLDLLPNNKFKRKIKLMKLAILRTGFFNPEYGRIGKLSIFLMLYAFRLINHQTKLDQYKKISQAANELNSDLIFFSNENLKRMLIPLDKKKFKETVSMQFEDTELIAPKEWDIVLKIYYGDDYMVPKRENYYA